MNIPSIEVIVLDKRFEKCKRPVLEASQKILKILKKQNVSAEIYLANTKKMRFLNRKFRGRNKSADILSFNEPADFPHPELTDSGGTKKTKPIGEIYLNPSNVSGQMSNVNLLIHGLLHLLGYNHKKKSDRIRMEKAEQKLLLKIRSTNH